MRIEYEHDKTKDEAYEAIDSFLDKLVIQHKDKVKNYSKNWNSSKDVMEFTLDTMDRKISGNIQLHDHSIVLEGNVPFLAELVLKPMIEKELEKIL